MHSSKDANTSLQWIHTCWGLTSFQDFSRWFSKSKEVKRTTNQHIRLGKYPSNIFSLHYWCSRYCSGGEKPRIFFLNVSQQTDWPGWSIKYMYITKTEKNENKWILNIQYEHISIFYTCGLTKSKWIFAIPAPPCDLLSYGLVGLPVPWRRVPQRAPAAPRPSSSSPSSTCDAKAWPKMQRRHPSWLSHAGGGHVHIHN